MALTPKDSNPSDTDDTKPSAEDEVIIREIDEAVRKDDAAEFLQKYGVMIGSVLTAGLLGLGGYLFYDAQVEAGLEEQSEQIVRIIDYAQSENFAEVKERAAPLLDAETPGVRTSARFLQAGAALELGEVDRAVELYAQVATDEAAPKAYRDLARLREVTSNFDDREAADIIAKLEPIAVPGNALYGSAAELLAMAHLEAGNTDKAGALFAAIAKNEDLPASLRDRALQMTGPLGVDAVDDVEKLLEGQGGIQRGDGGSTSGAGAQ